MPDVRPEPKPNPADALLVADLARKAGEIALSHFGKDPQVWWKENESPVSQADFEVDRFLQTELLRARPDYGWLSEETEDSSERLDKQFTFIVDPIDGTRGFLNGADQWCVSIAIVCENRPVVGALYAPVLDRLVLSQVGGGASDNGIPIAAKLPGNTELFMTGPHPLVRDVAGDLPENVRKSPFVPSLAWRLAMVATGEIDVALARASARDWDLAAADLIVQEAGARLSDLADTELTYNCRSTRHGTLVASHRDHHRRMLDIAGRHAAPST